MPFFVREAEKVEYRKFESQESKEEKQIKQEFTKVDKEKFLTC